MERRLDGSPADDVPVIASILELWDRAGLELGEVAIVGGPHPLSPLVARAALWSGAGRVLHIGSGMLDPGIETIAPSPADAAVARLTALVAGAPGVAAVDLSGSSTVIELIVATLPRWGRLLLAGPSERFAVDFYNDVHRKGAIVAGAPLEPATFFDRPVPPTALVERATRLLARDDARRALSTSGRFSA